MSDKQMKKIAVRRNNKDFRARLRKYSALLIKIDEDYSRRSLVPDISAVTITPEGQTDLWAWASKEAKEKYLKELGRRQACLKELRQEISSIMDATPFDNGLEIGEVIVDEVFPAAATGKRPLFKAP